MSRGFTLIEVVVALLILEVAVVAALGTLTLASSTLGDAEGLERAVATAEGVLDSVVREPVPGAGSRSFGRGVVAWSPDSTGALTLRAVTSDSTLLFEVSSVVLAP